MTIKIVYKEGWRLLGLRIPILFPIHHLVYFHNFLGFSFHTVAHQSESHPETQPFWPHMPSPLLSQTSWQVCQLTIKRPLRHQGHLNLGSWFQNSRGGISYHGLLMLCSPHSSSLRPGVIVEAPPPPPAILLFIGTPSGFPHSLALNSVEDRMPIFPHFTSSTKPRMSPVHTN